MISNSFILLHIKLTGDIIYNILSRVDLKLLEITMLEKVTKE